MKEINQKPNEDISKELLFRCACGHHHFVSFTYWVDKSDNWIEFNVAVIDPSDAGLRYRIKNAFKHIFNKKTLYWGDVILDSKDLEKVQNLIKEYLEKIKDDTKKT